MRETAENSSGELERAEPYVARLLARREAGEPAGLEAYLGREVPPSLHAAVRRLHAASQGLQGLLAHLVSEWGPTASTTKRIRLLYGRAADPGIRIGCRRPGRPGADGHPRFNGRARKNGAAPDVGFAGDSDRAGSRAGAGAPDLAGALDPTSAAALRNLTAYLARSGRYVPHEILARGGMGTILRVTDRDLRRDLAMKVATGSLLAPEDPPSSDPLVPEDPLPSTFPPSPDPLAPDPPSPRLAVNVRCVARFLEEAQVTGQLDHPGIVPVHDVGMDDRGLPYFTMRLVRGRSLGDVFRFVREGREGWTETRVVGVILEACNAVAYAHSKGVIHRDLKPSNIMVGRFGEVYVMDWGLAKVRGHESRRGGRGMPCTEPTSSVRTDRREDAERTPNSPLVTLEGNVVGTPAYMCPEQARGHAESIDCRADVYSMGAMLYELLAGRPPYVPRGARLSARTLLAAVVHGPPRAIRRLNPTVPAELAAICEKAMARKRRRRYATLREMADDLRAYLEQRVVRAYESGAWAELRKWFWRNLPLASSLVGLLLLAAGWLVTVTVLYHQR